MIIIYLKKGSKKTADTEIAVLLEKSYLSEMPNLFHKYEKDRIQRLIAMAPKRQSERIKQNAETTTMSYRPVATIATWIVYRAILTVEFGKQTKKEPMIKSARSKLLNNARNV